MAVDPRSRQIKIYDTTLRDGTQGEGVSFSMEDKVRIAHRLDQPRHPLHRGRLAGLQSQGPALLQARPGRGVQAREDHRLRLDPAARRPAAGGRQHPGPRRGGAARGHHLRQVVGLPRDRGARHHARGEPRDDRATRSPTSSSTSRRSSTTPSTSSTASSSNRDYALRDAAGRGGRGRPLPRPLRHQRREPAARGRRDHPRGQARGEGRDAARHPRPQRHRVRGGQLARRGGRGRRPRPGDDQRLRRALRQRQPRLDHPEPHAEDGARVHPARRTCASCATSRASSPSWPTASRGRPSPTSATPPSPTRAASTSPPC